MILLKEILTSDEMKELKGLKKNQNGGLTLPAHIKLKIKKHTKGRKMRIDSKRDYLAEGK